MINLKNIVSTLVCFLAVIIVSAQSTVDISPKNASNYAIIIETSAPESVQYAAIELQAYFKKVVGTYLKLVKGDAPTSPGIRIFMSVRQVLYAPVSGKVTIKIIQHSALGEFQRYLLTDLAGNQLGACVVYQDRTISFNAEAGKSYVFDVPSRKGNMQMEVTGASVAYKTDRDMSRFFGGLRINAHDI